MAEWFYDKQSQSGEFRVTGDLTITQVGEVAAGLLRALEEAGQVICDLKGVGEVDVAGLQLLCAAHRLAVAQGKGLRLRGGDERLRGLVHAVGFDRGTLCPEGRGEACFWAGMA